MKQADLTELGAILRDPWKRYSSGILYHIVDKEGRKVPFIPNPEQEALYWGMHHRNVIPKARQLGMTTAIQIFMLDRCLFNAHVSAGVIAHNREDAQRIFDTKVKFAYDHLPDAIRERFPNKTDNTNELAFENGSSLKVGTSLRGGAYQYLHVSEFGKVCAKMPDKATEIITGSLNTVPTTGIAFVESTAEGAYGAFFQMCKTAEQQAASHSELTPLDYKLFFFPWWRSQDYVLHTPVEVDNETAKYFRELETEHGVTLSQPQQWWYAKKQTEQQSKMKQEYPSYLAEAFHTEFEGLIFGKQMTKARSDGRIKTVPYLPDFPVFTFWDLGRNDVMSIWFMQRVGMENRFIDYEEDSGYSIDHYAKLMQEKREDVGYIYGDIYLPHDANVVELTRSDNKTRAQVLKDLTGVNVRVVPRVKEKQTGIDAARRSLQTSWFDQDNCEEGLKALEAYRYEYDERKATNRRTPLHDWASNAADAYMQFAQGFKGADANHGTAPRNEQLARKTTRGRQTRKVRATGTSYRV